MWPKHVTKKPRARGGYSPARGLQNTNPQWVVAPVEKRNHYFNHLTPNGHYMSRTAQLTSRCCILYIFIQQIYVLNILNMLH